MNVGELRRKLRLYPDDTIVVLNEEQGYTKLCYVAFLHIEENPHSSLPEYIDKGPIPAVLLPNW